MEILVNYYRNNTSQAGEDGMIEEVLKRLKIEKGNFSEFGALDGVMFCNTKILADKGWSGLYIEASSRPYNKLVENYKNYPDIVCVKSMIGEKTGMGGKTKVMEYSFDNIMDKNFPNQLDLLIIDTDGGDYEIFRGIEKYLPKVLMIECNPFRHPLDEKYYGYVIGDVQESLFVMNKLAEEKGYKILSWNGNTIFVKEEYYHLFDVSTDLMELWEQGFRRCYVQNGVEARVNRHLGRMGGERKGFQETKWLREIHAKYRHEHGMLMDPGKDK